MSAHNEHSHEGRGTRDEALSRRPLKRLSFLALLSSLLPLLSSLPGAAQATTVTSFQVSSPQSGTLPFTVGLGFKKGDVPTGASLSIPNSQVITKSTWSDGSVKMAIASGEVVLTANTPVSINVLSTPASGGTNMTCANIQGASPAASFQAGGIGTVNLSSLLATPVRTWASGPEMVECHYRSAVGSDPTLTASFHVRLYAGGRIWVRAVAENGYVDVPTANKTYTPLVTIGGAVVYNNGGASLTHYAHTRWTAEGWIGGDPQVTPKHNTTYLEASRLVPNYMNQTPSAATLNGLYQTYTPLQQGDWPGDMGATGFSSQIGLLPLWDSLFVTSQADARAFRAVLADAKALNSYAIVWDDSATGMPAMPSNRPTWTVDGNNSTGETQFNAGLLIWDIAHHGSGGYMAYLLTGDYYYFETLEDQAAMCYLMDSSASGSGVNRDIRGVVQTRGVAWCLRTLGQLAGIGGNDAIVNDYRTLLSNAGTTLSNIAHQPGMNQLGYAYSYEVDTNAYGGTTSLLPPWQEHFLIQSIGYVSDLEPFATMTTWNALRDYGYKAPVGTLGPNGSSSYCFTEAAQYNQQVADTLAAPATNWYPDWGTLWTKNFGSPNTACGNTLHGTSGADPLNASTGYWGNLMPAIAYAVDHGAPGALAAWTRLTGATNWSTVLNSGFGDTPIWGIVPRSGIPPPPPPATSPCDVNKDGVTNVADVQLEVNMALGLSTCTNPSGVCTVVSVQRVVNAALGGTCVVP